MAFKVFLIAAVISVARCQEEDDGSYNPEKYEKPYENLIGDDRSFPQAQPGQFFGQQQSVRNPTPEISQLPFAQQFQQNPAFQQPSVPQSRAPEIPQPFQFSQQFQNPVFQQQSVPQTRAQEIPQQFSQQFQNPAFQQPSFGPAFRQQVPDSGFGGVQSTTNYRADSHQRAESIDGQGNVLGEYSYVDPNGKTITVKYKAGKDGFHVEGDHIPKSPQPVNSQPQFTFAQQTANTFSTAPQQFSQEPAQVVPQQQRSAGFQQFQNAPFFPRQDGGFEFNSNFQ